LKRGDRDRGRSRWERGRNRAGCPIVTRVRTLWLVGGASFSVAAIAGAVVEWARIRGGDVHYGDVGGWVGGFGSIVAAVAAVGIAVYTNMSQNRKEEEARVKAQARALRRARRVFLRGDRYNTLREPRFAEQDSYLLYLENAGSTPIYEIECGPALIAYIPYTPPGQAIEPILGWIEDANLRVYDGDPAEVETKLRDTAHSLNIDPFVLDTGGRVEITFTFQNRRDGASPTATSVITYHRVSFVDDDGYRIGWTYERLDETIDITALDSVRGKWALVDDTYPNKVDDAILELVERAPAR
jgi:hypothetical protein